MPVRRSGVRRCISVMAQIENALHTACARQNDATSTTKAAIVPAGRANAIPAGTSARPATAISQYMRAVFSLPASAPTDIAPAIAATPAALSAAP